MMQATRKLLVHVVLTANTSTKHLLMFCPQATLLEPEESKFSAAISLEQFSVYDLPDSDGKDA